jgi:hypothetical protein
MEQHKEEAIQQRGPTSKAEEQFFSDAMDKYIRDNPRRFMDPQRYPDLYHKALQAQDFADTWGQSGEFGKNPKEARRHFIQNFIPEAYRNMMPPDNYRLPQPKTKRERIAEKQELVDTLRKYVNARPEDPQGAHDYFVKLLPPRLQPQFSVQREEKSEPGLERYQEQNPPQPKQPEEGASQAFRFGVQGVTDALKTVVNPLAAGIEGWRGKGPIRNILDMARNRIPGDPMPGVVTPQEAAKQKAADAAAAKKPEVPAYIPRPWMDPRGRRYTEAQRRSILKNRPNLRAQGLARPALSPEHRQELLARATRGAQQARVAAAPAPAPKAWHQMTGQERLAAIRQGRTAHDPRLRAALQAQAARPVVGGQRPRQGVGVPEIQRRPPTQEELIAQDRAMQERIARRFPLPAQGQQPLEAQKRPARRFAPRGGEPAPLAEEEVPGFQPRRPAPVRGAMRAPLTPRQQQRLQADRRRTANVQAIQRLLG